MKRKEILVAQQLKYVFFAFLFGTTGLVDYVIKYKIEIYPFGYISALIFISIIAYAIVKYQLLDIRVALTRLSIFVFVYTLVLGLPFGVGFYLLGKGMWLLPVSIMAVLATAGPSIYLYLQKRAEDKLLAKQRQYQATLRNASLGMGRVKELKKLLELIAHILTKTVNIKNCGIFLLDSEAGEYTLKASRGEGGSGLPSVDIDSGLVRYLKKYQSPLVSEEFHWKVKNEYQKEEKDIKDFLNSAGVSLIIPCFVQDKLLAIITLGPKKSHEAYSADDILIFSILANQAALAMENCMYWEAEKTRMKEEGLQVRLVSLDAMASSFAHEVHNPVQGCMLDLGLIKEDVEEAEGLASDLRQGMLESVARVSRNVERISNMIYSILDYSRKSTGELFPITIEEVFKGFEELMRPKIKDEQIQYTCEVEPNLPLFLGDKVQMEEILVNFVLNAIHALAANEKGNKKIYLKAFRQNHHIRIEFSDNGYGIKKNLLDDIFLVSVTTKASSEGTGLGLYRVRKIIDLHQGRVWAESEGEGKGAKFIIELPVSEAESPKTKEEGKSLF